VMRLSLIPHEELSKSLHIIRGNCLPRRYEEGFMIKPGQFISSHQGSVDLV
jgi:hypothetical protein